MRTCRLAQLDWFTLCMPNDLFQCTTNLTSQASVGVDVECDKSVSDNEAERDTCEKSIERTRYLWFN